MNIQEAIRLAIKSGEFITRSTKDFEPFRILPTDNYDCLIVYLAKGYEGNLNNFIPGKRWNPKAEDLLANDWEVKSIF